MIDVEIYTGQLLQKLQATFGERLLFVGLQGSYLRNEATQESDIDIMVIIDDICVRDLDAYRSVVKALGDSDKSCGFICGRKEMANWNPLEVCQLLHTTKDLYGTLANYVPAYTHEDERNFVKLSLNNLYHGLSHGYIHADREHLSIRLPETGKSVFFILQNMHYLSGGDFVVTKQELMERLGGEDEAILEMMVSLDSETDYDLADTFSALFMWCQHAITRI